MQETRVNQQIHQFLSPYDMDMVERKMQKIIKNFSLNNSNVRDNK